MPDPVGEYFHRASICDDHTCEIWESLKTRSQTHGDGVIVVTAAPVISGDPGDVRVGGFPAWPVPLDATGAGIARSLVRAVFGVLGMPAELTYDTALVISELATNAYVHA